MKEKVYLEKSREIPIIGEKDIIIGGGGPAGIAAAVAGAREGADVMLIERYGYLTGAHASASVGTFCGIYNEIPYRCLLPQKVENLLVVGRCISSEHEAQASVRVAGQCFAEGEAAGTAAAMALKAGVSPREVDTRKLRDKLIEKGASL